MSFSLLFPSDFSGHITKLSESSRHDLGLDAIIKHIAQNSDEERYIMNTMAEMTDSPEVAAYRIEIFDDIIHNKKMRDDIMDILKKIRLINDYGRVKRVHSDAPGMWELVHRFDELRDYITTVEALYNCLSDKKIKAKGLIELKEMVKLLFREHGFGELKRDLLKLRVSLNDIKSVTLGINLNERFEAEGVGLISINSQPFTKSAVMRSFSDFVSGRDSIQDEAEWNGTQKFYPVTIATIPEGDSSADITRSFNPVTDYLLNATIKKLKNVLSKYVTVTINDVMKLIPEFMYYVRWAEYITNLTTKGYNFCKPQAVFGHVMNAKGMYNLKLACLDVKADTIVANDLEFSREKCVYILTGANRGGKTTITQAVGLLFILAGGGIYVPGTDFIFSPADCVYTHFPVDEEMTMNLGRLGEECRRFHDLFLKATDSSLILLNESFSTTSFEEGYYIAGDSVKAILDKGIRTIYNTHMHKLGYEVERFNSSTKGAMAVSVIVKTEGHERSYKIELAPPQGMSFARDIAEKYGVTYELLMEETNK